MGYRGVNWRRILQNFEIYHQSSVAILLVLLNTYYTIQPISFDVLMLVTAKKPL